MKTAFQASKLAIAAFIVPYMFCYNPAMLLIDTNPLSIAFICVTSVLGVFGLAAALEGYCFTDMNIVVRLIIAVGGLMLIHPATVTDLLGLLLLLAGLVYLYINSKRNPRDLASSN